MMLNPEYPALTAEEPEACLDALKRGLGTSLMKLPLEAQLGNSVDCMFGAVAKGLPGCFCWWIGDLPADKVAREHRHLARMRSAAVQRLQATGYIASTSLWLPSVKARAQLFYLVKLPAWRMRDAQD